MREFVTDINILMVTHLIDSVTAEMNDYTVVMFKDIRTGHTST